MRMCITHCPFVHRINVCFPGELCVCVCVGGEGASRLKLHSGTPACSTAEPRFAVAKASQEWRCFPETGRELCFSQCSGEPEGAIQSLQGKYGFKVNTRVLLYTLQYEEKVQYLFSLSGKIVAEKERT